MKAPHTARRVHSIISGVGLLLSLTVPAASAQIDEAGAAAARRSSIVLLRTAGEAGDELGTAVLVGREPRGDTAVLSFVTSSCLFRPAFMGGRFVTRTVYVTLNETDVPIDRGGLFMPAGTCVDVAIFRLTTGAMLDLAPHPISFDSPPSRASFQVLGFDAEARPVFLPQTVRFRSTLQSVGDRDASSLRGCVGAPAIRDGKVFGVVSECAEGRSPVISLLSVSRSLIEQHLPAIAGAASQR